MSALVERYQKLREAFDERVLRERALMAFAAVLVVGGGLWMVLVDPVWSRLDILESQQQQAIAEQAALQAQAAELEVAVQQNPVDRQRRALESKQRQLASLEEEVAQGSRDLIAPQAMVTLLRRLLSTQTKLELVGLDLLPPEPIYRDEPAQRKQAAADEPERQPIFYRHAAELRLKGRYLDLLNYIEELEAIDVRLGWQLLHYNVEEYPGGEALIRVQTLSLGKAWLGT